MIERRLTLVDAARKLSASFLDLWTWCAEGKMTCQARFNGEWIEPTSVQISEALKKTHRFIEVKPGAITWYLGNTGHPRPPTLEEIYFMESEIKRIKAESNSEGGVSQPKASECRNGSSFQTGHSVKHPAESTTIKRRITFEEAKQRLSLSEDDFVTAYIDGYICGQVMQNAEWVDISAEQVKWARLHGDVIDLSQPEDVLKYLYPPSADLHDIMFLESAIAGLSGNEKLPTEGGVPTKARKASEDQQKSPMLQRRFDFWDVASLLEATMRLSASDVLENAANGAILFERLDSDGNYILVTPQECKNEHALGDPMKFYSADTPVHGYSMTELALQKLLPKGITVAEAESTADQIANTKLQTIVDAERAKVQAAEKTPAQQITADAASLPKISELSKSRKASTASSDKKKAHNMKRREANVQAVKRFLSTTKKKRDYYDDAGKVLPAPLHAELKKLIQSKTDLPGLDGEKLLERTAFIAHIGSHPDFPLPKAALKSD